MARTPKTETTKAAPDILPPADDDTDPPAPVERDASPPQEEPRADAAPEPVGDPRRDDIVQRYRELRKQENAKTAPDDVDPDEPEPETDSRGENEPVSSTPAAEKSADGDGTKPAAPAQDTEIELIIDGKTVKKPLKEVVALAQINGAADSRLEEAKRLLTEAKSLASRPPEHQRSQQEAAEPTETRTEDPPEHQPGLGVDAEKVRDIVHRIQVGDEDEGAEALTELLGLVNSGRSQEQQVRPDQVNRLVQEHLLHRDTQQEIDGALKRFGDEYPEIAQDSDLTTVGLDLTAREMRTDLKKIGLSDEDLKPIGHDLRALAQLHRTARLNGHQVRPYGEVLSAVGNYMADKFGIKRQDPQPGTQTQPQQRRSDADIAAEREARKRTAQQQPRTAGARVPAPQPPRPKSKDEVVQEMRAARGFRRTA